MARLALGCSQWAPRAENRSSCGSPTTDTIALRCFQRTRLLICLLPPIIRFVSILRVVQQRQLLVPVSGNGIETLPVSMQAICEQARNSNQTHCLLTDGPSQRPIGSPPFHFVLYSSYSRLDEGPLPFSCVSYVYGTSHLRLGGTDTLFPFTFAFTAQACHSSSTGAIPLSL